MGRKTFISYKYSEAKELRDKILEKLGKDSNYYQGETSESPDISDTTTENIKRRLKDMIYSTSVTIVIISPNIRKSKWIDWEIEYSLKEITRQDKTSRSNGIVGVIMKCNEGYDWLIENKKSSDGCSYTSYKNDKLFRIISENRFNKKQPEYICENCKTIDKLNGSYISLIDEDTFLNKPSNYIENAFTKSKNINKFHIKKQ